MILVLLSSADGGIDDILVLLSTTDILGFAIYC